MTAQLLLLSCQDLCPATSCQARALPTELLSRCESPRTRLASPPHWPVESSRKSECRVTLAPISTSFSRSVVNNHWSTPFETAMGVFHARWFSRIPKNSGALTSSCDNSDGNGAGGTAPVPGGRLGTKPPALTVRMDRVPPLLRCREAVTRTVAVGARTTGPGSA